MTTFGYTLDYRVSPLLKSVYLSNCVYLLPNTLNILYYIMYMKRSKEERNTNNSQAQPIFKSIVATLKFV